MTTLPIKTPSLSAVLSDLIEQAGIYEAELSRAINLPRATINRIRTGKIIHPKSSTLLLIANYFQISVDQLLGKEPIINFANNKQQLIQVPLINWDKINQIDIPNNNITDSCEFTTYECNNLINNNKLIAIIVTNSEAMWPLFDDNSIIIINTEEKHSNRKFVLAKLYKTNQIIIRRLLIDGNYKILQPINNSFPSITMEPKDIILGTIIHVKKNF